MQQHFSSLQDCSNHYLEQWFGPTIFSPFCPVLKKLERKDVQQTLVIIVPKTASFQTSIPSSPPQDKQKMQLWKTKVVDWALKDHKLPEDKSGNKWRLQEKSAVSRNEFTFQHRHLCFLPCWDFTCRRWKLTEWNFRFSRKHQQTGRVTLIFQNILQLDFEKSD